jgi:copper chaperone CopZ
MACNHCKASVEKALQGVPGVESVVVDLASGRCVAFGVFDKGQAIEAVEGIGFSIVEEKC